MPFVSSKDSLVWDNALNIQGLSNMFIYIF